MRGKYIVIEGTDGSGKSTQVELLRQRLAHDNISSIEFHEPGGTPIADAIRTVIKDGNLPRHAMTNVLLFTAARYELWQHARQQLENGVWVIAARNYYSTLAYQGHGEGIALEQIRTLTKECIGEDYLTPDFSVILTLEDLAEREKRISNRGPVKNPDTFESRDSAFQSRVNDAYLSIAADLAITTISAQQTREAIASRIYDTLMAVDHTSQTHNHTDFDHHA